MATIQEQVTSVREKIGETIATGETEGDTLFSDAQITLWITSTTSLDGAALEGWKAKAAHWAGLVNVTDGAASRAFSDLLDHAQTMIKMYSGLAAGPTNGRTRVGKIVRS